jgi:phospholipid/cholesterol/gamma-HCH transport system ATP-binding protein
LELLCEQLTVRRGERMALTDVTFQLSAGSSAYVLGTTGSGKSTLLKALAGLIPVESGHVRWDGRDAWALAPPERRERQVAFGMVFQSDALFDSRTVLDNVTLPLLNRGTPRAEAERSASEVLGSLGLKEALSKSPGQLSGGMRKRVGLARALIARPAIILADDPLAGLDPATAAEVCALILEVTRGKTLLVACPEPLPQLPLDRWLVLRGGALLHDGAPRSELLDTLIEDAA